MPEIYVLYKLIDYISKILLLENPGTVSFVCVCVSVINVCLCVCVYVLRVMRLKIKCFDKEAPNRTMIRDDENQPCNGGGRWRG